MAVSGLLLEVTVVETLETLAVASLILAHLMNGVMDSVEVQLLSESRDTFLVFASTVLSCNSLLKIGLGIPDALTEELCELGGMLSLFESVSLESLCDLRISLSVCLTAHCKVHSDLSALTVEVCSESFDDLRIYIFSDTDPVLVSPGKFFLAFYDFYEFLCAHVTDRALCRSGFTFVDITAYCTSPFLCHNDDLFKSINVYKLLCPENCKPTGTPFVLFNLLF